MFTKTEQIVRISVTSSVKWREVKGRQSWTSVTHFQCSQEKKLRGTWVRMEGGLPLQSSTLSLSIQQILFLEKTNSLLHKNEIL